MGCVGGLQGGRGSIGGFVSSAPLWCDDYGSKKADMKKVTMENPNQGYTRGIYGRINPDTGRLALGCGRCGLIMRRWIGGREG